MDCAVCAWVVRESLAEMLSNFFRLKALQSSKMAQDATTADGRARHQDEAARWDDLAKVAERDEQLAEAQQVKSEKA